MWTQNVYSKRTGTKAASTAEDDANVECTSFRNAKGRTRRTSLRAIWDRAAWAVGLEMTDVSVSRREAVQQQQSMRLWLVIVSWKEKAADERASDNGTADPKHAAV